MSDLNEVQGVAALKKRNYSIISIVSLIYCAVAAGAFGVEEMIQGCGPGMTIVMLVAIAVFWALPDCYRTAEMSSVLPGEGGYYYWAKKTLGEFWAFQIGWWGAVSYYVCGSTYIVLAVNYLSTFVDLNNAESIIVKLAIILFFTVINLLGLKEVSALSVVFSVIILIAFTVITVVGFADWNYNPIEPLIPAGMSVVDAIGMGIGIGIWMYCGWGVVTMVAGEISNPQVISKALRIVVPLIALSYILPTIAGLASVGHWSDWTTVGAQGVGFSTVLEKNIGPAATVLFVLIAIVGQLAIFNTNIAGGSRTFFVLADDDLFPKKLITKVSRKRGVPYVGILTISAVTIIMMQLSFKTLILIQVIPILAAACFMSVILIKTRRMIPVELRKQKGYFVVGGGTLGLSIVVISPMVIAILAFYLNGLDYFLFGLLFLLSGIVLYIIFKLVYGGYSNHDNVRYPLNTKTKLARGDVFRIGKLLAIIGATAISGSVLLKFIEGSWGPEYYLEEYGHGLLSSFSGMLMALLIGGIVCFAATGILYLIGGKIDEKCSMPIIKQGDNILDD
jgi:amino acid transporter